MTSTTDRAAHPHTSRYPTREEIDYIASRLVIRAIERYIETPDYLRSQVGAHRLGLDEFELRDATADLQRSLEGMAQVVQNREDRLKAEGHLVVPNKPRT